MTVDIDEATGLPVLPDGQIWRVQRTYPPRVCWMSDIQPGRWGGWLDDTGAPEDERRDYERRTSRFLGVFPVREVRSRLREDREVLDYEPIPADFDRGHILEAATDMVEADERMRAQHSLFGDYPPKRLGAVE